jgi:tetratricopeptide (TPR) repeat protein
MITSDGIAKIMDFGLAKLAGRTKITRTGTTIGTPAYMSPEQAQGQEVDQRSDVFSLGVILYEMIAGRPPFKGDYEAAVLYSILHDEPEPLSGSRPDVPALLQQIIDRMLEKDASKRYESSSELAFDLSELREETRTGVSKRARKVRIRKWHVIPAVAVIAVVVAYLAFSRLGQIGSISPGQPASGRGDSRLTTRAVTEEPLTIVVAPFWGATEEATEEGAVIRSLIDQQLRDELGGDASVIILSDAVFEVPRSEEDAVALGRRRDAIFVIWGEVFRLHGEVEIHPHLTYAGYDWPPLEQFISAFEADLSQPSQLAMRRTKAEEVVDTVTLASAVHYSYSMREHEKALAILRRIPPRSILRIVAEAWVAMLRGNQAKAESLCFEASSLDTLDPWPYYTLGSIRTLARRHDEAVPLMEKALSLAPNQDQLRWGLANAYAWQGNEDAFAVYREVVDRNPESPEPIGRMGWLYYKLEHLDEAIQAYKLEIRFEPENYRAYQQLGLAYEAVDSLPQAVASFEKGVRLARSRNERAELSWYLAGAYQRQGEHSKSIVHLENAVELDPDFAGARGSLGFSYAYQGRYSEAVLQFKEACDAAPGHVYWNLFYALLLHRVGRAEDGRIHLRELAGSLEGDAWENSVVRFFIGELDEATFLSLAGSENPETTQGHLCEAYYYTGMAYILETDAVLESRHGDTARAGEHFEKCLHTDVDVVHYPEYRLARSELDRL